MSEHAHTMNSLIQEIVDAIVAAASTERVILFGSAARCEVGPDSDVDLLVMENVEHLIQHEKTLR